MKRPLFTLIAISLLASACLPTSDFGPPPARPLPTPPPLIGQSQQVPSIGEISPQTPAVKIALLLPLSGESVSIGNAMLDAATMALYDNYLSVPSSQIRSQIVLLPKDTGNTPAEAARGVKQAIEQGATFMIGPLFSQSVTAVVPYTKQAHISMLTFSNNRAVAGDGVYTFGFLPEQQVARMSEYAFLHGLTRVALLAPNDSYGQKIQDALAASYLQKGGAVAPIELYAPSPANIDAAVARLATYNNANQDRKFQAIFIADGGYQLKNIVSSLRKTNIDLTKIKLLGTGLWDDPEIAKIPEMRGAWFSSSPPDASQNFERHFIAMYGYKPVRLASLAYDAVTIAINLTISGAGNGLNGGALTDPQGFSGLSNGLVRLRPDGTSDRKLAIMEISGSGFTVIDAAPKAFSQDADTSLPPLPSLSPTPPPAAAPEAPAAVIIAPEAAIAKQPAAPQSHDPKPGVINQPVPGPEGAGAVNYSSAPAPGSSSQPAPITTIPKPADSILAAPSGSVVGDQQH